MASAGELHCQQHNGREVPGAVTEGLHPVLACLGSTFVPELSVGYLHTQLSVLFGRCCRSKAARGQKTSATQWSGKREPSGLGS